MRSSKNCVWVSLVDVGSCCRSCTCPCSHGLLPVDDAGVFAQRSPHLIGYFHKPERNDQVTGPPRHKALLPVENHA